MKVFVCGVITPVGLAIEHVYTKEEDAVKYTGVVTLLNHDRFYDEMEVEDGQTAGK